MTRRTTATTLHESYWLKVAYDPDEQPFRQVRVEFTQTPYPDLFMGPGDAHEMGQVLYHAGVKAIHEDGATDVQGMPGYGVPPKEPDERRWHEGGMVIHHDLAKIMAMIDVGPCKHFPRWRWLKRRKCRARSTRLIRSLARSIVRADQERHLNEIYQTDHS